MIEQQSKDLLAEVDDAKAPRQNRMDGVRYEKWLVISLVPVELRISRQRPYM